MSPLEKLFYVLVLLVCFFSICTSESDWRAHTRKYGEACVNHDECIDFRMICPQPEATCQCDQFHDWIELDAYTSECVLNETRLRTFLAKQEETKHEDELSEEAHNLFLYLGLSGIVAISFGILLTLACVIFVFT
ncbi:uncharacterized protein LOC128987448 [Macrosteles quadrilineatus]|uniref:uncharacterized protein LOC128987448 n=1 Tax=Macrosteles quadrilineatus TaxID=74068 RepID=UPI0023E30F53|nr:uncharacterized protein LOC128987448 [Macrosteles quadrilineatus]